VARGDTLMSIARRYAADVRLHPFCTLSSLSPPLNVEARWPC
jgi:hypothetical protein